MEALSRIRWTSTGRSSAVLAFLSEHHQQQTQIKSLGSALFWNTTQPLTVSSNIQNPFSFRGQSWGIVMEIYATTVIGSFAGALGHS